MSFYPARHSSFRTLTTFPPTPNSSSIRNSSGRDSAQGQGSSILTTNGLDDGKSSGFRSSVNTRNEDLPVSTELSFGPGTSILGRDSGFRRLNSFTDFNAPLNLQDGGFQSSQSFPTSFSSGVDQPDTTTGHATVVSIFCHDCGLFFRGVREEGVEVLDRHRCTGTINGGYADDFDFLPLLHSNGGQWPSYREESDYFQPSNLNHARSGMMGGFPPAAHGYESSYSDGPNQSLWGQGSFRRRHFRFAPSYNDLDQSEVSGPPNYPPPMFGSRDADPLPGEVSGPPAALGGYMNW